MKAEGWKGPEPRAAFVLRFILHPSAFILANPRARPGWLLLAEDPTDLVDGRLAEGTLVEGCRARQKFVKQHAQRVDVATGVDVHARKLGLLGAHVEWSTDELVEFGEQRPLGERPAGRLGHAEVDDFGYGRVVDDRYQDIGGLQIAVNDPLLVGVLHRPADEDEQLQPLGDGKPFTVAIVCDRDAAD